MTANYTSSKGLKLEKARGVYADLYYMVEEVQYRIECRDNIITFYRGNNGKFVVSKIAGNTRRKILQSFFIR